MAKGERYYISLFKPAASIFLQESLVFLVQHPSNNISIIITLFYIKRIMKINIFCTFCIIDFIIIQKCFACLVYDNNLSSRRTILERNRVKQQRGKGFNNCMPIPRGPCADSQQRRKYYHSQVARKRAESNLRAESSYDYHFHQISLIMTSRTTKYNAVSKAFR